MALPLPLHAGPRGATQTSTLSNKMQVALCWRNATRDGREQQQGCGCEPNRPGSAHSRPDGEGVWTNDGEHGVGGIGVALSRPLQMWPA